MACAIRLWSSPSLGLGLRLVDHQLADDPLAGEAHECAVVQLGLRLRPLARQPSVEGFFAGHGVEVRIEPAEFRHRRRLQFLGWLRNRLRRQSQVRIPGTFPRGLGRGGQDLAGDGRLGQVADPNPRFRTLAAFLLGEDKAGVDIQDGLYLRKSLFPEFTQQAIFIANLRMQPFPSQEAGLAVAVGAERLAVEDGVQVERQRALLDVPHRNVCIPARFPACRRVQNVATG